MFDRLRGRTLRRILDSRVLFAADRTASKTSHVLSAYEAYWARWFEYSSEISTCFERLDQAYTYHSYFPSSESFLLRTKFSESDRLGYHYEMFVQESCILHERLGKMLGRMRRLRREPPTPGRVSATSAQDVKRLFKELKNLFGDLKRRRGERVHEGKLQRFSALGLPPWSELFPPHLMSQYDEIKAHEFGKLHSLQQGAKLRGELRRLRRGCSALLQRVIPFSANQSLSPPAPAQFRKVKERCGRGSLQVGLPSPCGQS